MKKITCVSYSTALIEHHWSIVVSSWSISTERWSFITFIELWSRFRSWELLMTGLYLMILCLRRCYSSNWEHVTAFLGGSHHLFDLLQVEDWVIVNDLTQVTCNIRLLLLLLLLFLGVEDGWRVDSIPALCGSHPWICRPCGHQASCLWSLDGGLVVGCVFRLGRWLWSTLTSRARPFHRIWLSMVVSRGWGCCASIAGLGCREHIYGQDLARIAIIDMVSYVLVHLFTVCGVLCWIQIVPSSSFSIDSVECWLAWSWWAAICLPHLCLSASLRWSISSFISPRSSCLALLWYLMRVTRRIAWICILLEWATIVGCNMLISLIPSV